MDPICPAAAAVAGVFPPGLASASKIKTAAPWKGSQAAKEHSHHHS